MKKSQVDHVLRAAREHAGGKTRFVIVGSQALHGKHPDVVDDILVSREVDLYIPGEERLTDLLNAIGEGSRFHETFGYYADPVGENTAVLPKAWKGRLVNLPPGDTDGAVGLCLDPHDLAISKYIAGREKDRVFTAALVSRGLLDRELLLERLSGTKVEERLRAAARSAIERDFSTP
jgi:hypothetical protein